MKPLCPLILSFCGLFLLGCASTATHSTAQKQQMQATMKQAYLSQKNPMAITLFTNGKKPSTPYKVMGKETIPKYNLAGIKRQEAQLREAMRNFAANLGGDAVIDITHDDQNIIGTVIAFQDSRESKVGV